MFDRTRILVAITACALAIPAAGQTPAPTTAFDGKYVGTATKTGGGHAGEICDDTMSEKMTITGGEVIIQEILFNGNRPLFRGSVNAMGEVSAFHSWRADRTTGIDIVSGIIHDSAFVGQRRTGYWCYYGLQMQKVSAAAEVMPFDGDYIGVSRESSCLANGVPVTLIIRNSVVIGGSWQGNVNPQGVVVMGNRLALRVDGQIDRQGMIRAQGSSSDGGCTVTFTWRKQAG